MKKKAIEEILWLQGFYPFSFKYDLTNSMKNYEETLKGLEIDDTTSSIISYSPLLNNYFKHICKELEVVIKKSTLSKDEFQELLIANLNRTEVLVYEETIRSLSTGISYDNNMLGNIYISKPEFQNKKESAWGLIDAAIETSTLNLNYLKYLKFLTNAEKTNELTQVEVIRDIERVGSIYNAVKQSYDKIIWSGGVISGNKEVVHFKSNSHYIMLENAALTRLVRNTSQTMIELEHEFEEHKEVVKTFFSCRTYQIIDTIVENLGDLVIKYKARPRKLPPSFITFIAPVISNYSFYRSEKIVSFGNLAIIDLVNLFANLYDLIDELPLPHYEDTDVQDLTKFRKFNPKIRKNIVLSYFKTTTKYNEEQIKLFLNLITQKGKDYNLFRYSIFESGDFYYFSHSSIKRGNMLYLIDKWLEDGRCDLAERGGKFENYIRNFLKTKPLNEFAKFKLIEKTLFKFTDSDNNNNEEEIDLVIVTDNIVVVAEIKCTTYPYDPDDFYKSLQVIKKAKNQVNRKSKYLEDNWSRFVVDLGERAEKKIEKIVIVNFPHHAGKLIDDIPVVDANLFLSYFSAGKIVNMKIDLRSGISKDEILYYDSIEAFSNNFGSFFKKPIPIYDLIARQKLEQFEVSLEGTVPKLVADRVLYVEKTPENY